MSMFRRIRALSLRMVTQGPLIASLLLSASTASAGTWGLLASPGRENQPVKGIYFFPGDPRAPQFFTLTSNNPGRDYQWNDQGIAGQTARQLIVQEIGAVGANVIFAQYSAEYSDIHFVNNSSLAFIDTFRASQAVNGPQIIPSLEAVFQCDAHTCPPDASPLYDPLRDITPVTAVTKKWFGDLTGLILNNGLQNKWAQLYDRTGTARYAIQISEAGANALPPGDDAVYASALDEIAAYVESTFYIKVGFVLTPTEDDYRYRIVRSNPDRVANLTSCQSCLAIAPYYSEISRVRTFCEDKAPANFRGFIDCNLGGDLTSLVRFKKDRTKLWINSGIPYYADLDVGYDAHLVFNSMYKVETGRSVNANWGETGYIFDRWRNTQSELKGPHGPGSLAPSGIIFNSWNGYTEAAVALDATHFAWDPNAQVCHSNGSCETVGYPYPWGTSSWLPSASTIWAERNFSNLRRRWLTDVFSADPRICDHYYYEGGQRKFHLVGAICEKFIENYGEFGPLGIPTSNSYPQGSWSVEDFQYGKIYWGSGGAHEMHGGIYSRHKYLYQNGRNLGAPLTDELQTPDGRGRYNHFEFGSIYWTPQTFGIGIWGPIRTRWADLGWERGRLGYPTLEPTPSGDGIGWYARFEGGNIYYSNSTPASEVWGSIFAEYGRLGWERSWLGYPLTGERDSGYWCVNGRYNQFQHGFIDWCPGKAACAHNGNGHCADGRTSPTL